VGVFGVGSRGVVVAVGVFVACISGDAEATPITPGSAITASQASRNPGNRSRFIIDRSLARV
jgi:hypothetical protein